MYTSFRKEGDRHQLFVNYSVYFCKANITAKQLSLRSNITSSFSGDRKKRCRTDKLSKIKASGLILFARRRTRVRRVAKFVRSINNFRISVFFKGSIGLLNLQNPLLYPVLYGLRFFYIPILLFFIKFMYTFKCTYYAP